MWCEHSRVADNLTFALITNLPPAIVEVIINYALVICRHSTAIPVDVPRMKLNEVSAFIKRASEREDLWPFVPFLRCGEYGPICLFFQSFYERWYPLTQFLRGSPFSLRPLLDSIVGETSKRFMDVCETAVQSGIYVPSPRVFIKLLGRSKICQILVKKKQEQ